MRRLASFLSIDLSVLWGIVVPVDCAFQSPRRGRGKGRVLTRETGTHKELVDEQLGKTQGQKRLYMIK